MTEVPAENEAQLQDQLKNHPELLPLDELGLTEPAVVVGRESSLDSGRIDLVVMGAGGELALVEFKTGPQNPDFRECLAQLLDYGSDLWGMSLEDFETRVAQRYFSGPFCPPGTPMHGATLETVLAGAWGEADEDAVDWRQRLQTQLRDGSFHYIAVAQKFTPPVLRTLQYLNATMKSSRFSAVELVRFSGQAGHGAFEARFVAGAERLRGVSSTAKTALAGVEDFLGGVADDEYRHALGDFFDALVSIEGLTIYWGTRGASLRVAVPGRSPLSIGWLFPPGPPGWMGLSDVTLGWYEDANGLELIPSGRSALQDYLAALRSAPGGQKPRAGAIHGLSFPPAAVTASGTVLAAAVETVVGGLIQV